MKQRDVRILEKIVQEIEYLEGLLHEVSKEKFLLDATMQRAAAMSAINVGELAKHLSDDFYGEHPHSELRLAAKTRDVYAHGYYTLKFDAVYLTATQDYPRVKAWIQDVLNA